MTSGTRKHSKPTAANSELLDRGHESRLLGNQEDALRIAITILEAAPGHSGAALLSAMLLRDAKRTEQARPVAKRLVDGFVRRGDLPCAVLAARLAADLGEKVTPLFESIANAFGKGSSRVADVAPKPPPLPAGEFDETTLAFEMEDALLARLERALQAFLATTDDVPEKSRLPLYPLFGGLTPRELAKLLEVVTVREVGPNEVLVTQGDDGEEAFVVVRGYLEAFREHDGSAPVLLAALGAGSIVGEMSLVSQSPRAATLIASEPTTLLVVARDALEGLASKEPTISRELASFCHTRMIANLMRHSAILGAVSVEKRASLIECFEAKTFSPGETLVKRDAESQGLFLIASGSVEVVRADADGERLVIANLGPGDVVGEISLVLRRPATADVVARHPTVALELTRRAFEGAIREHPTLLNQLYDLATKREEETRNVIRTETLDAGDFLLV